VVSLAPEALACVLSMLWSCGELMVVNLRESGLDGGGAISSDLARRLVAGRFSMPFSVFLAATQPWMRCWCCYLPVYSSTDSWARCEVERSGCFHRVWGSTVYQRGIHSSFSINHRPKRSRSVYDRTSLTCAPLGLLPDALIPMPHRTTPCPGVQYCYESVSIGTNAKPDSTQGYQHTYKGSH
jgi:hypothetical protein